MDEKCDDIFKPHLQDNRLAQHLFSTMAELIRCSCEREFDSIESAFKGFEDAFLTYGSHTEDNINSIKKIQYLMRLRPGQDRVGSYDFSIRQDSGNSILVADLLWALEGAGIPNEVKEQFPDVSHDEWSSAIRFCIILLSSLGRRVIVDVS